jgi:orotidine-5'-phosphate decarboxylase
MSAVSFADRLAAAVEEKASAVCLGIDPQLELFPAPLAHLASSTRREVAAAAVQRFCDELLDAVADAVAVVKPQVAFFERLGPPGWTALERLVRAAHRRGLLVIADAKRGDIASTAAAYADYFFGDAEGEEGEAVGADRAETAARDARPASARSELRGLGADAMTLNPYLGVDSLDPFLRHVARGKGCYLLAKTSNPGSRDLQDLAVQGPAENGAPAPLYRRVAAIAQRAGAASVGESGYASVGIVAGATGPREVAELRRAHPTLPFLVPGYGAQGAGPDDVAAAFDEHGRGAIVNASRSLIFAYRAPQHRELGEARWAEASRRECLAMRDAIASAVRQRSPVESARGLP